MSIKTNSANNLSTIVFKIDMDTKLKLSKKARIGGLTLSEYFRNLALEDLGAKQKPTNPLLELFGIMSDKESEEFNNSIYNSRVNKD
jgi:hypothetical protein